MSARHRLMPRKDSVLGGHTVARLPRPGPLDEDPTQLRQGGSRDGDDHVPPAPLPRVLEHPTGHSAWRASHIRHAPRWHGDGAAHGNRC